MLSDDGMSKKSAYRNLKALHDFVELFERYAVRIGYSTAALALFCVITNRLPQRSGTETVIAFASARNSHHCNFFQVMGTQDCICFNILSKQKRFSYSVTFGRRAI